ncbi:MAG: aminopeptidase P family protein [Rhodospirillales bacterium]
MTRSGCLAPRVFNAWTATERSVLGVDAVLNSRSDLDTPVISLVLLSHRVIAKVSVVVALRKAVMARPRGQQVSPYKAREKWDRCTAEMQPYHSSFAAGSSAARRACPEPVRTASLIAMNTPRLSTEDRLAALRTELKNAGLDAFLVPRGDAHRGEYVPAHDDRLRWLTGFSGSAGQAVVLADRAALFVDGRYTLQAAKEAPTTLYEILQIPGETSESYLERHLKAGQALGYDPWLHSLAEQRKLARLAERCGARLVALGDNPVDAVWPDQPPPPLAPARPQDLAFAGEPCSAKRQRLAEALRKRGTDAAVLSLPDSIAWLLNLRGGDVARTPFVLSFALLHADARVSWFVAPEKVTEEVATSLDAEVTAAAPEAFGPALDALASSTVLLDPASAPAWVAARLEAAGASLVEGEDPCQEPKATKNEAERQGTRSAHQRDGIALTRFLAWFDREAKPGVLSELACSDRLEDFRREGNLFMEPSFDTIAGSGPHGAVVHYRVTPESDRTLQAGELMVLDSGGQYLDGTTDVTRTLLVGEAPAEERDRYTRVLQGHIALATVRFPKGTSGTQLDVLARQPLWAVGLDYDHGTGHGVGSYLSVHEGPQRISKHPSQVALLPGMILSNEPGYYKADAYGIRIENLVLVVESPAGPGEERPMLAFETLTLAPLERRLIETDLLSAAEIAWVDAYHARVLAEIGPALEGRDRAFLEAACKPLA